MGEMNSREKGISEQEWEIAPTKDRRTSGGVEAKEESRSKFFSPPWTYIIKVRIECFQSGRAAN